MANKLANPAPAGPVVAGLIAPGNTNKAHAMQVRRVGHLRRDDGAVPGPTQGQGWPRK